MSKKNKLFEEGSFWLARSRGEIGIYHDCPSLKTNHDILLPEEIQSSECFFCGDITIPDSIKTLWLLSKE